MLSDPKLIHDCILEYFVVLNQRRTVVKPLKPSDKVRKIKEF